MSESINHGGGRESARARMGAALRKSELKGAELAHERIEAAIDYVGFASGNGGSYGFEISPDEDLDQYRQAFAEVNGSFQDPGGFELEITPCDVQTKKPAIVTIKMPNRNK